jgi:hypothetical protein
MPEPTNDAAPTHDDGPRIGRELDAGLPERIVHADNRIRLLAFAVFVAATAAGLLAMRWITARIAALERLVPVDSEQALRGTVALLWWLTGLAAGMALVVALIVLQKSRAIRRANRYPVPGARVLRDTVVRTGADARRVAAWGDALAIGLALGALGLLVTVHLTIRALTR